MIQFLGIFSFLSVLLRGLTLASEAMTVGGVLFLLLISRGLTSEVETSKLMRLVSWSAIVLATTQLSYIVANSVVLIGTADIGWMDVATAGYCTAGFSIVLGALAIAIFVRTSLAKIVYPISCGAILFGSVATSHCAARLDYRSIAVALTFVHQLAAAAWIGGMPYLLLSVRHSSGCRVAEQITKRFSRMAMLAVASLLGAGLGLSFLYIGSAPSLFGTTYGVMVLAKVVLAAAILAMAALNLRIVLAVRSGASPDLLPLRRFAEVEAGIGFTVILAAAGLTSAPPAIDVRADRVTALEIAQRMKPQWPRLQTPSWNDLSPPTPLPSAHPVQLRSFGVGQVYIPPTPGDIGWSEYNHHWAGLIVLAIGLLSVVARRFSWARNWPVVFLALAAFILIRADPENWPLGPRSFWASFQVAEVAQHRVFVVLIALFGTFEWCVQTGRISRARSGLVFPLVCAAGGALLLTHSHSVNNIKEEFLAELSHLPLAILGVFAGWSRWVEIRGPQTHTALFARIWPTCFVLMGIILLTYRES